MKKLLILISIISFIFVSCINDNIFDLISMNPGSLGVSASEEVDCSEGLIKQFIKTRKLSAPSKNSSVVNWWSENGYNFLNYRCVKIYKNLYMVTFQNNGQNSTKLSIRSRYSFNKKEWVFASEFGSKDDRMAEIALDYLIQKTAGCSNNLVE